MSAKTPEWEEPPGEPPSDPYRSILLNRFDIKLFTDVPPSDEEDGHKSAASPAQATPELSPPVPVTSGNSRGPRITRCLRSTRFNAYLMGPMGDARANLYNIIGRSPNSSQSKVVRTYGVSGYERITDLSKEPCLRTPAEKAWRLVTYNHRGYNWLGMFAAPYRPFLARMYREDLSHQDLNDILVRGIIPLATRDFPDHPGPGGLLTCQALATLQWYFSTYYEFESETKSGFNPLYWDLDTTIIQECIMNPRVQDWVHVGAFSEKELNRLGINDEKALVYPRQSWRQNGSDKCFIHYVRIGGFSMKYPDRAKPDTVPTTVPAGPGFCYLSLYSKDRRPVVAEEFGSFPYWAELLKLGEFRTDCRFVAIEVAPSVYHLQICESGVLAGKLGLLPTARIGAERPTWTSAVRPFTQYHIPLITAVIVSLVWMHFHSESILVIWLVASIWLIKLPNRGSAGDLTNIGRSKEAKVLQRLRITQERTGYNMSYDCIVGKSPRPSPGGPHGPRVFKGPKPPVGGTGLKENNNIPPPTATKDSHVAAGRMLSGHVAKPGASPQFDLKIPAFVKNSTGIRKGISDNTPMGELELDGKIEEEKPKIEVEKPQKNVVKPSYASAVLAAPKFVTPMEPLFLSEELMRKYDPVPMPAPPYGETTVRQRTGNRPGQGAEKGQKKGRPISRIGYAFRKNAGKDDNYPKREKDKIKKQEKKENQTGYDWNPVSRVRLRRAAPAD